jgi:16S rRNA A1518/A1519 N6-dimethyltransferase RsmA/KsgA/DIM1 with predicted DNA glycosylase/AP lyase activity
VIELAIKDRAAAKNNNVSAECYYAAMRTLFAHPRKTVLNNLSGQNENKIGRESAAEALNSLKIDPKSRPQDLTVENIAKIARALFCA